MKRTLLLGLTLAALLLPAGAHAAVPCRDKIYNEWYSSGKISTSYPQSCYKDALKHIPTDAKVYSNLAGDIKAAMQAALQHPNGGGPTSVGSGHGPGAGTGTGTGAGSDPPGPHAVKGASSHQDHLAAAPLSSSSGGGVPTPILVLGGIAVALAVAGLTGTGVQRLRKRRAA